MWFRAVCASKRFPSQYALLDEELRRSVHTVVNKLREVAAAEGGVKQEGGREVDKDDKDNKDNKDSVLSTELAEELLLSFS